MAVGDEWSQVNLPAAVQSDLVETRDAGHIDQRNDPGAHLALDLQEEIGPPGNDARSFLFFIENMQNFCDAGYAVIILPHRLLRLISGLLRARTRGGPALWLLQLRAVQDLQRFRVDALAILLDYLGQDAHRDLFGRLGLDL